MQPPAAIDQRLSFFSVVHDPRREHPTTLHKLESIIVKTILVTLSGAPFVLLAPALAFAGAGGSRGKRGLGLLVLILLPFLIGRWLYLSAVSRRAKADAWKVLHNAKQTDELWDKEELIRGAKSTFHALQETWSNNDLEGSLPYLHPDYLEEYQELLQENIKEGHFNRISGIDINEVDIVLAKNYLDDSLDMYVAYLQGSMYDAIYDEDGTLLHTQGDSDDSGVRAIDEYWYFQREGDAWLVKNICQEHSALFDVSVDEENIPIEFHTMQDMDKAFAASVQRATVNKADYVMKSFIGGLGVTLLGYGLYFLIGKLIFQ